jgi:signal peptidase
MKVIDYTIPVLVSSLFMILLLVFYLYKTENKILMRFLSARFLKNIHFRAEIKKDTRKDDVVFIIVLLVLIFAFGLNVIVFQVVISDSMMPEFQRGDIVLTQTVFKEPEVGDIITFKAADVQNPITHRVTNIRGDLVTTKGDNNPLTDDYGTTISNVIGKAININGHPFVIKGVGAYFILDFSKEGKLYKYGDQYEFLQQMFITIRTWGYVITIIAFAALLITMTGKR